MFSAQSATRDYIRADFTVEQQTQSLNSFIIYISVSRQEHTVVTDLAMMFEIFSEHFLPIEYHEKDDVTASFSSFHFSSHGNGDKLTSISAKSDSLRNMF